MKNRRGIFKMLLLVATGIGLYKLIQSQSKQTNSDEQWTSADMPDLTGKVMIVTGANSGIGFEAAKAFAQKGATTIMACRTMPKANAAKQIILNEQPDAKVEVMSLDLASLRSVMEFAEAFKAKFDRLDVLVNNAGIMMVPYGRTEDGFELQMGTNHLGHFALTGRLFDLLLSTPNSRVVNVTSNGHRLGSMDFDNLLYENGKGYSSIGAYGRSKLANLLFTYELQRRFNALSPDSMAVSAHPGTTDTNLTSHLEQDGLAKTLRPYLAKALQGAEMGALPTIRAAVDSQVEPGDYFGPDGFMERGGYPVLVNSSKAAKDPAAAQKLWEMSEELTGIQFGQLERIPA